MTFVLIDYKGGSAFKDCGQLPHTVGMVTDLDAHLVERALASLSAELTRREHILLRPGAKDIEDYQRHPAAATPTAGAAAAAGAHHRRVRVAWSRSCPTSSTGLVNIAQRGRSLGVHLILATQRPAGVVCADIRANTNLRIALRVTDPDESTDVIDAPDAAHIAKSTPGRCYVRSGASAPVPFSRPGSAGAGRAAGRSRRPDQGDPGAVARLGQAAAGDRRPPAADEGDDGDRPVGAGRRSPAGRKAGCARSAARGCRRCPSSISSTTLPAVRPAGGAEQAGGSAGPVRARGRPGQAGARAAPLDLAQAGTWSSRGGPRGRSTVLRTIAGRSRPEFACRPAHLRDRLRDRRAAAARRSAALRRGRHPGPGRPGRAAARQAPRRDHAPPATARGERLRGAGRAAGGAPPAHRLPWMLLLLDWWEGYAAAFEQYDFGRLIETLLQILREGSAVGLRAVVTTDRAALTGQVGAVFRQRMILRLTDPDDSALADIPPGACPPTTRGAGHVRRQAEPARGPDRHARPGPVRAGAGPGAAAARGEPAQRFGRPADAGSGRCGSTRCPPGSPWRDAPAPPGLRAALPAVGAGRRRRRRTVAAGPRRGRGRPRPRDRRPARSRAGRPRC